MDTINKTNETKQLPEKPLPKDVLMKTKGIKTVEEALGETPLGIVKLGEAHVLELMFTPAHYFSFLQLYDFSHSVNEAYSKLFVSDVKIVEDCLSYISKLRDLELKLWKYVEFLLDSQKNVVLSVSVYIEVLGRAMNIVQRLYDHNTELKKLKAMGKAQESKRQDRKSYIFRNFVNGLIKMNTIAIRLANDIVHKTFDYLRTHDYLSHDNQHKGSSFILLANPGINMNSEIPVGLIKKLQALCKQYDEERGQVDEA